ncbi:hypothetical protein GCM10009747_20710 [Agromyces humatus]|uniref:Uncharacterized protein n=1 Tax=Agromyces humatus TaxID=279573 RepID=A0ABP4WRU4_9MICO
MHPANARTAAHSAMALDLRAKRPPRDRTGTAERPREGAHAGVILLLAHVAPQPRGEMEQSARP